MATYIVVDKDKDPLGPNEINAGEAISVSDGDVFIIDPTADGNITFQASGGLPAGFDIQIADSNVHGFSIKIEGGLSPSVTIGDDVDLADVDIDAKAADQVSLDIGDAVTLGRFEGAVAGPNTVVIGDGFSTTSDWVFGAADDSLTVGADATFKNLDAGAGNDTITFGDRATIHDVDTKSGNDSVTFGDDLDANDIKTSDGDDTIRFGENAQVNAVDGGNGTDTFYTETAGLNEKNIENSQVVCYAADTLIDTPFGPRRVDDLRVGHLVDTMDAGPCHVRWVRSDRRRLDRVPDDRRPVLIKANALGDGVPSRDLVVSPQHRILVGDAGQFEDACDRAYLVPARALTDRPGIQVMRGRRHITWVHFALDRHHLVRANGCYSESLYLGRMVVKGLRNSERRKLVAIFGPIPDDGSAMNGPAARPFLTVGAARRLVARRLVETGPCAGRDAGQRDRGQAAAAGGADRAGKDRLPLRAR
ncbi:Hint domain-containing protein [Thalassococcus sp. CAU 1522]|uniref:Hint domain-containing protein n=1 Tax=Thalassococcus arenae TaxID=2851652 RepID=A0ABS6N840_9RHOB|nr:Hint domain-containing protein [Thalassococcus arenae]